MPTVKKKAFTLFELMIVIVIIGAVYALLVQNFTFRPNDGKPLGLDNLPSYMRKMFKNTKEKVEFVCIDDCGTCKFRVGSKDLNETINPFESHSSPEVYVLVNDSLEKIEFGDIFEDEKSEEVCFKYTLYPNKSSDKMVLEYKDNVYFYDNLFEKTKQFDTTSDAEEYWVNRRDEAKEE